jgi:nickel transport protein
MRKDGMAILAVLIVVLAAAPAVHAHKVKVFAWTEGPVISGYVYFPGGARAQNVRVVFYGPEDESLGETVTNKKGEFAFTAPYKCDYRVVADIGDGHQAEYTLPASELPDDLAVLEGGSNQAAKEEAASAPAMKKPPVSGIRGEAAPTPFSDSRLAALVEKTVMKQVLPLREQIEQYEEKVRLHDILGGIGYIIGIMGIVYYLKASARLKKEKDGGK